MLVFSYNLGNNLWPRKHHCGKSNFNIYYASLVAQLVKNLLAMQDIPVRLLSWEDLLEKG